MATVIVLTSLGFMLIGWDNGLLGGVGTLTLISLCEADTDDEKVNGPAFNDTFGTPDSTLIGTIVAIYESMLKSSCSGGLA